MNIQKVNFTTILEQGVHMYNTRFINYVTCVLHSAMKGSCMANWKNDGKF